mmetsp:Transcript_6245/g.22994  ORF Transcript_6245/g.22994 Transcript_6245/m.22994 type:complete len:628 (-) Transcript_6245:3537-5420(-)
MAVVHPYAQRAGQHALDDGGEGELHAGAEAGHQVGRLGEDVLAKAHDGQMAPICIAGIPSSGAVAAVATAMGAVVPAKLAQQLPHLQRFGKVAILVHVQRLQELLVDEDHGVVLVLWLALAHDGVAREQHLHERSRGYGAVRVVHEPAAGIARHSFQDRAVRLLEVVHAGDRVDVTRVQLPVLAHIGHLHLREHLHQVKHGPPLLRRLAAELLRRHDVPEAVARMQGAKQRPFLHAQRLRAAVGARCFAAARGVVPGQAAAAAPPARLSVPRLITDMAEGALMLLLLVLGQLVERGTVLCHSAHGASKRLPAYAGPPAQPAHHLLVRSWHLPWEHGVVGALVLLEVTAYSNDELVGVAVALQKVVPLVCEEGREVLQQGWRWVVALNRRREYQPALVHHLLLLALRVTGRQASGAQQLVARVGHALTKVRREYSHGRHLLQRRRRSERVLEQGAREEEQHSPGLVVLWPTSGREKHLPELRRVAAAVGGVAVASHAAVHHLGVRSRRRRRGCACLYLTQAARVDDAGFEHLHKRAGLERAHLLQGEVVLAVQLHDDPIPKRRPVAAAQYLARQQPPNLRHGLVVAPTTPRAAHAAPAAAAVVDVDDGLAAAAVVGAARGRAEELDQL